MNEKHIEKMHRCKAVIKAILKSILRRIKKREFSFIIYFIFHCTSFKRGSERVVFIFLFPWAWVLGKKMKRTMGKGIVLRPGWVLKVSFSKKSFSVFGFPELFIFFKEMKLFDKFGELLIFEEGWRGIFLFRRNL